MSQPWHLPDDAPRGQSAPVPGPYAGGDGGMSDAGGYVPAGYAAGYGGYPQPTPVPVPADGVAAPVAMPAAAVPAATAVPASPVAQRDPARTALAALIVFVVSLVGLWSMLAYLDDMSATLASVDSGHRKLIGQLQVANQGLVKLEQKTSVIDAMNRDATQLGRLMETIDGDLAVMVQGVDGIGAQMGHMNRTLATLDKEITTVGDTNRKITRTLGGIGSGLETQRGKVRVMRRDVEGSATTLGELPKVLRTTNARLGHVNSVVCRMGATGIANQVKIYIRFFGFSTGNATINGAIVPPGGWRC